MMQHKYFPPEWDAGIFKTVLNLNALLIYEFSSAFLPFGWVNIVRLAWIHSQRQTVLSLEKVSEIYPTAVWVFPNITLSFYPTKVITSNLYAKLEWNNYI